MGTNRVKRIEPGTNPIRVEAPTDLLFSNRLRLPLCAPRKNVAFFSTVKCLTAACLLHMLPLNRGIDGFHVHIILVKKLTKLLS